MSREGPPRLRLLVLPVAVGLVALASASIATLLATASNGTPQRADVGSLSLVLANNGAGFSTAVSNLAPGDVVQRYVDLTNNGTLAAQGLTLAVAASPANALTADGATTRALRLSVNSCSGTWTPSTGACNGIATALVAATPLASLATPATLVAGAMQAGAVTRLQLVLSLPDQDEVTTNGAPPATSIQGLSTSLTFTFAQRQRAATVTTG